MQDYIFFLGHQPHLSLAEIEAVYGHNVISKIDSKYAILSLENEPNIDSLGGTTKISKLIKSEPDSQDLPSQLHKLLFQQISEHKNHKLKLGVSIYSGKNTAQLSQKVIREVLEKLRKETKKALPDLNLRTVEPKTEVLNTAQIIHGNLVKTNGLSLDILISEKEVTLAQTIQVPNLKKYTLRDYGKPKPSGKNGMLPPKLAQVMLNLSRAKAEETVLDPFCGSGIVLQEALLQDINGLGTDINPKIVEDAKENLQWLSKKFRTKANFHLEVADATSHQWSYSFSTVVCESYLGTPLSTAPHPDKLNEIIKECNQIAEGFLKNIHPQLPKDGTLVYALPCWLIDGKIIKLPVVEKLSSLGYNLKKFNKVNADLVYLRNSDEKSQLVGRDIYVLNKK